MDGQFIWYELLAKDVDAAADFYGHVFGWTVKPFAASTGADYRILEANGVGVGGLMALPDVAAASGMKPGWLGYVGVADPDAVVAKAVAGGASVWMPPQDVPGAGRVALLADPQAAPFYVMRGDGPGPSRAFEAVTPGHCGWNELSARDWPPMQDFYAGLFGWSEAGRMDMGPMGTHLMLAMPEGDAAGAMMNAPPDQPSAWLFYFNVADVDEAKVRLEAKGGTVLYGPAAVPGGQRIITARDPHGAPFALVGPAA